MIRCPNCHASHYSEGSSECTAVYYPPIWRDGKNVNPDMNVTTTHAHCCECHYDFVIKMQNGEVWTELGTYNPPKMPVDINITSTPKGYTPLENTTSMATINNNHEAVRLKYAWENDIEELKERVDKLYKMIEELAGEVYARTFH